MFEDAIVDFKKGGGGGGEGRKGKGCLMDEAGFRLRPLRLRDDANEMMVEFLVMNDWAGIDSIRPIHLHIEQGGGRLLFDVAILLICIADGSHPAMEICKLIGEERGGRRLSGATGAFNCIRRHPGG